MFAYDAGAPLDVVVHAVRSPLSEISYASPMGGRVPGYLVAPEGSGPFAGLVYMHPGQGNRSTFLGEALSLAPAGVVSLLIDSPFRRGDAPGVQAHSLAPGESAPVCRGAEGAADRRGAGAISRASGPAGCHPLHRQYSTGRTASVRHADHLFSTAPAARRDRVEWLGQQLGFAPPVP